MAPATPATPPRSSTELASALRRQVKPGAAEATVSASIIYEAAQHIEALVDAVSEVAKAMGKVNRAEVAELMRKAIAPDPITGQGDARKPLFFGIDHASGVERVGETYVVREGDGTRVHKMKIDGETVYRSPECLVETLRAVDVEGEAAAWKEYGTGVRWLCIAAADAIEKLSADVAEAKEQGRQGVLIERGILTAAEKRYDDLLDAFAKFDGEDWDFLLGEAEYSPTGPTIPYRAGRGGRERVWQEALKVLRSICESAEPKEESPEPSELAKLFCKHWLPIGASEEYIAEAARALDQHVAEQMLKSAE